MVSNHAASLIAIIVYMVLFGISFHHVICGTKDEFYLQVQMRNCICVVELQKPMDHYQLIISSDGRCFRCFNCVYQFAKEAHSLFEVLPRGNGEAVDLADSTHSVRFCDG